TYTPSWLTERGWTPPIGLEGWNTLGDQLRSQEQHKVLFGVTSGVSAPPFFEDLFQSLSDRGWNVTLMCTPDGDVERFAHASNACFASISAERNPSPLRDLKTLVTVLLRMRSIGAAVAVW